MCILVKELKVKKIAFEGYYVGAEISWIAKGLRKGVAYLSDDSEELVTVFHNVEKVMIRTAEIEVIPGRIPGEIKFLAHYWNFRVEYSESDRTLFVKPFP